MSVNKVILLGRVCQEPETRQVNDKMLVTFSLATSEKYKGEEHTEWHSIESWGKTAELIEKYVHKGDQIYIEGKIKTDSWEHEGKKHFRTKINALGVTFVNSKGSDTQTKETIGPASLPVDDLPF